MGMDWATFAEEWVRGALYDPKNNFAARPKRQCPICDYEGLFLAIRDRPEGRCPNCGSRERDRIIALHLKKQNISPEGKKTLHFAPERPFFKRWRGTPGYVAADLADTCTSEVRLDITAIAHPDDSFDLVICNHVLEHVPDDSKGMRELRRVLKPSGLAILSVPLDQSSKDTFTPPPAMSKAEREAICGPGHLRLYGMDFEDKLRAAGFSVERILFSEAENQRHRLAGEIVNLCRKA